MPNRKDKIVLNWSKRENDWMFHYPDRAGSSLMTILFEMLKIEENIRFHRMELKDGKQVERKNIETLKQMLTERGYDYTTFKITCNKLNQNELK